MHGEIVDATAKAGEDNDVGRVRGENERRRRIGKRGDLFPSAGDRPSEDVNAWTLSN
jgi:hypothetical protein